MDRDSRNAERLGEEIERIEIEHNNAQNRVQKVVDSLSLSKTYEKFVDKIQQWEAEQVDILISKNQALQILYLKHHDNVRI